MSMLAAYDWQRPGAWTRRHACHLLRRAGFAPSQEEIAAALTGGLPATIDNLFDEQTESDRFREIDRTGEAIAARGGIGQLAGWWLSRMVHARRPLAMRLTLFWHNHFATGNQKVTSPPMMLRQMRALESGAMGRFEPLVQAVARDPAMIVWLDGDSNRRDKPNENFARELFELFTLGPGPYSEHDLREAARAFSGWHQRNGVYRFQPLLHDDGEKIILGQTGAFDGDDVVRIAIAHPACAPFLAKKLLREFVCDAPTDDLITATAELLRETKFEIAAVMRTVLSSEAFFATENHRARIKSPVEFCVGLARSLEMRAPGQALQSATSQMGQRLFEPPSVKGWDGHRRWINATSMLVRMNVAAAAASGDEGRGLDAAALVAKHGLNSAEDAIAFAERVMLDDELSDASRKALRETAVGNAEAALRTVVAAIGACPEYQMA